MEGRQVEEAMLAVLHTVLLHRSTGKFHYKKEGTYSIGTVGTQDVDCDFIDFTYVRVSSEELDRALRKVVGEFKVRRGVVLSGLVGNTLALWLALHDSDGKDSGRLGRRVWGLPCHGGGGSMSRIPGPGGPMCFSGEKREK